MISSISSHYQVVKAFMLRLRTETWGVRQNPLWLNMGTQLATEWQCPSMIVHECPRKSFPFPFIEKETNSFQAISVRDSHLSFNLSANERCTGLDWDPSSTGKYIP